MDDRRLLERVRRGDEEAFARLYARHQRAIYRYAMHMCGAAAADDIVQDTFVALLGRRGRYDPARGAVVSYLFGIARHHVAKRLTALGGESVLDDEPEGADGIAATTAETPLDVVSRLELVRQVREAIESLPPVYRESIVLCELQEMDYATAAAIMQCPIGTVRSRLHRGKAMLITKLAALQPVHSETAKQTR